MFTKILSLISLTVLSANAFAASETILGKWVSDSFYDENNGYSELLDVSENSTTITLHCWIRRTNTATETKVVVPTKIENDKYHIQQSASSNSKVGNLNCKLDVQPISFTWSNSSLGKRLHLSTKDGQKINLWRPDTWSLE